MTDITRPDTFDPEFVKQEHKRERNHQSKRLVKESAAALTCGGSVLTAEGYAISEAHATLARHQQTSHE
jgi:hypothetical protein